MLLATYHKCEYVTFVRIIPVFWRLTFKTDAVPSHKHKFPLFILMRVVWRGELKAGRVEAELTFGGTQPHVTEQLPISCSEWAELNNPATREYKDFICIHNRADIPTPLRKPAMIAVMPNCV